MKSISTLTSFIFLLILLIIPNNTVAAPITVYDNVIQGGLVLTGNTLGLSKENAANGPGTEDSIGTFISYNQTSIDNIPSNLSNPWGEGTTNDWTANGSTATLDIQSGATVIHAQLIWGGSYNYVDDITDSLDTAISLAYNDNSTITVNNDPLLNFTISEMASAGYSVNFYTRSADVTSFIALHGPGVYTVHGVPGTQHESINSLNAAGWCIAVVYELPTEPIRRITLFVDGSFIDEGSHIEYNISDFATALTGDVTGALFISVMEGDADLNGDQALISKDGTTYQVMNSANNPDDNFFASQINQYPGDIDTRGSFGIYNHNAMTDVNISGGRQGWDVTSLEASSQSGHLENNQQILSIQLAAAIGGDTFIPNTVGVQIDVAAPWITSTTTGPGSGTIWNVGEPVTILVNINNLDGMVDTASTALRIPLSEGFEFTDLFIDGVSTDPGTLTTGMNLGVLTVGTSISIEADVTMITSQVDTYVTLTPILEYTFVMAAGIDEVTLSKYLPSMSVEVNHPPTAPVPVAPVEGETVTASPVQLKWKKAADPDGDDITYEVLLSTNSNFTGANVIPVATLPYSIHFASLGIIAIGMAGLSLLRSRSQRWRLVLLLVIILLFIGCPQLNDSEDLDLKNPDEEIQVIENLETGTSYWWKIRAVDARGGVSESGSAQFTTDF
ncbi:MAG: hypothetical protein KAQ93_02080 [Spirochaetales bacterium]|nr:hypothetical protein [Spirochaetales bacterium]